MSTAGIAALLAFVVLWWLFSVLMFLGALFVIGGKDAVERVIDDVWRLIRL